MATIQATVISATSDENKAEIVLEFDSGTNVWQKTYTMRQTEPINFQAFKDMVVADLRRDLKIKAQLQNITSQVGKTFSLTV